MATAVAATPVPYPVRLEVDYPEQQSRWKALLRIFLAIPVLLLLSVVQYAVLFATLVLLITVAARGRPPQWLFNFHVAANQWIVRATAYFLLLTDEYAPFGEPAGIRYDAQYPERLSRWRLVFWKLITAVPHVIVLSLLQYTIIVVSFIAWIAILASGRYPKGLHDYVTGFLRWGARVHAYAISLTDEFPPFSLSADAGAGSRSSYIICSVIGVLVTAAYTAGTVAFVVISDPEEEVRVSYQDLVTGQPVDTQVIVRNVLVTLPAATDPADQSWELLTAQPDHRFVEFIVIVESGRRNLDLRIDDSDFRLKDTDGDWHDVFLMISGGRTPPVKIDAGEGLASQLIFELPAGADPGELRYDIDRAHRTIVYEFE